MPLSGLSLAEYLQNEDAQAIVERKLQLAIQVCMDIANYIIVHRQLKIPEDERSLFAALAEADILERPSAAASAKPVCVKANLQAGLDAMGL